ncbi:MAG: N-formylglutamate amidohydrolase [Rhodospirillaceae bacterium]|nr:N-formylglutamate amidohydrolase [Rhodospirillaceae bacterium]
MTSHHAPHPLLADDEPPPYEIVNADGAAPLVLVCDHASNRVPRSLHHLGLAPAPLRDHIAWDIGAADVARRLARRFDAPLALTNYSRLVIDCNRTLADPTSIPAESDGIPVPGNRGLAQGLRLQRAEALFRPYHDAVEALTARKAERQPATAFVSIHSFTPVFQRTRRPWHIGILWNEDGRLAQPLLAAMRRDASLVVGDNEPYSGRDATGYSIQMHAERRGLVHVAVEIRQDMIATADGAGQWAQHLGDALAEALPQAGIRLAAAGHAP